MNLYTTFLEEQLLLFNADRNTCDLTMERREDVDMSWIARNIAYNSYLMEGCSTNVPFGLSH